MSEEKKFEHVKIEWPIVKDEQGNVIKGTIDGNYAVISINRPDSLNALTEQTVSEISGALRLMELDNSVRAVVLRGTKDITKKPSFSVGADLAAAIGGGKLNPSIPVHMAIAMRLRHREYDEIEQFSKPLIAAVDGFALGGGLELTLACDIVIATDRSRFGLPEVNRGIIPANGGVSRMAARIGVNRALRMCMFGEHHDAKTMQDWGYVSWVAPAGEEFEKIVHEKAKWFGEAATTALYVIKNCIKFGTQHPQIGLIMEQIGFGMNAGGFDMKEGILAFNRKVKCPVCKGKGKFEDGTKCENCGGRRKLKDKPHFKGFA